MIESENTYKSTWETLSCCAKPSGQTCRYPRCQIKHTRHLREGDRRIRPRKVGLHSRKVSSEEDKFGNKVIWLFLADLTRETRTYLAPLDIDWLDNAGVGYKQIWRIDWFFYIGASYQIPGPNYSYLYQQLVVHRLYPSLWRRSFETCMSSPFTREFLGVKAQVLYLFSFVLVWNLRCESVSRTQCIMSVQHARVLTFHSYKQRISSALF